MRSLLASLCGNPDAAEARIARFAAETAAAAAKAVCPVDTRHLRNSIHVRLQDGGAAAVTQVPYAGMVEYGTRYTQPQPFMAAGAAAAAMGAAAAVRQALFADSEGSV